MTPLSDRAQLEADGFVVLRAWFDPAPLEAELDEVDDLAFSDLSHRNSGVAGNTFRYVPVMCERTPVSLALTRSLAEVATVLLDGPVLPGRSKATTYFGSTDWHRDSDLPVRSVGIVTYLEPLDASNGALCVVPGSHDRGDEASPAIAVPTEPGDVIVFDERLRHASSGGGRRRQWRVDFVSDDGSDALRRYYAGTFSPEWDAGYDVDRFPSFGSFWRSTHPEWARRLGELGALDAAQQEDYAARKRRGSTAGG